MELIHQRSSVPPNQAYALVAAMSFGLDVHCSTARSRFLSKSPNALAVPWIGMDAYDTCLHQVL
jgi:hypothetical protein